MKAIRTKNRIKAFAVSFAACLALIFSTVFAFGYSGKAVSVADARAAGDENGIRFVQVAAGSDFAIGLTYDGRLFGWSLSGNTTSRTDADSLGGYYTTTPTEIPVTFRMGPGGNQKYDWSDNSTQYHATKTDTITSIATTATTAAFITQTGYIYTWGRDGDKDITGGYGSNGINNGDVTDYHYLLLRPYSSPDSANQPEPAQWHTPYIIDYGYYGSADNIGLYKLIPAGTSYSDMSLAGGENNYIFVYRNNGDYYSYVWGSVMYLNVQRWGSAYQGDVYNFQNNASDVGFSVSDNVSQFRHIYKTQYTTGSSLRAVAGGYNVGMNAAVIPGTTPSNVTSLTLKGKNFITSAEMEQSGNTLIPVSYVLGNEKNYGHLQGTGAGETTTSSGLSDIAFSSYTVQGGLIGSVYALDTATGVMTAESSTADLYYARQAIAASGSGTRVYSVAQVNTDVANASGISSSNGQALTGEYVKASVIRNAVSLGNEVGYGISGNKLYAWGDNANGQSGLGKTQPYYQYPTETLAGKGNIISVAAGKQLSADASHKAFNYADTLGDPTIKNGKTYVSFSEDVQNKPEYITGAITEDGKLYVWSDASPTPKEIVLGLSNDNAVDNIPTNKISSYNRFTAVYSGYGRNLFAITRLGKLVRVTCAANGTFSHEIYDYFKEIKSSTTINNFVNYTYGDVVNWTVDSSDITKSNQKSAVKFTIENQPTKENLTPDIGAITFYVNNAQATATSVKLNGEFAKLTEDEEPVIAPQTYKGKARESLISTNAVGDVYRILNPDAGDDQINYVSNATAPSVDEGAVGVPSNVPLSKADITPKFYFKADGSNVFVEMTDRAQWSQMFDYEMVGSGNNVGIKIIPKRSTQNGTVNMQFQVARYDCSVNAASALYYDHLACNVEFTIDNSTVVRMYDAYDSTNSSKSAIPLLDPSNEANKYYSLAVQNISAGFSEFSKFINSGSSELEQKIIAYITDRKSDDLTGTEPINWDPGFPDVAKIEKGNLQYYLGEKTTNVENNNWYTGKYKYLFADRDLDIVRLSNVIPSKASNTAIAYGMKTVKVRLTGLATGDTSLTNKIAYTADLASYINKCFTNVYGMMNITIAPGEGDAENYVDTIEFSYDILLFTANGTTGRVDYGNEPTVDSFNTIDDTTKNDVLEYSLSYEEYITYNSDFTTKLAGAADKDKNKSKQNWTKAASVFSQASVRLNSKYQENGKTIYGASKETATALGLEAVNHLEVVNNNEYTVGGNDIVINLSEYIQAYGTYVSFSHNNGNISFNDFDSQFVDSLTGNSYITLSRDSIRIKLLGAHPIYFTVTVQRFFNVVGVGNNYFENDERVTISFSFTNIKAVSFTVPATSTQEQRTYDISREMDFYVFGYTDAPQDQRVNVINSIPLVSLSSQYRDKMELSSLSSNHYNILTPKKKNNKIITLTPNESGTAVIQFTLTAFGQSIPITLTFNVSGVTTIKDKESGAEIDYTVNLSNASRVYMTTLTTGLRNSVGEFIDVDNFGVLYDDKTKVTDGSRTYDKFAGVEFARVDGAEQSGYLPEFVKSVAFYDTASAGKAYLRIDIDSDATADQLKGEYWVYVKFVDVKNNNYATYADAENDTILTAKFKLIANKKVAFVNGAMLEIVADVDHPKKENANNRNSDWYMTGSNTEAKIYVPLQYLCSIVDIPDYDEYEIYLVSVAEGSAKYINPVGGSEATRDVIEITPIYNTKAPITLNVSIMNTSKGASENKVVAFSITVKGISTTLSKGDYTQIWLVAFFSSLGLLMVIFLIRMIIYWRRRAKQRALIKRNQELIKMRDRVHNKASSATRDQALRTKLKLQDPKYAKMFNEMKKDQNGGIGVTTVGGDDFGASISTGKKSKKKKGGKKSMAELKAELAAKKAAFAQAQTGAEPVTFGAQPVNPFGDASGDGFGAPGPDFGAPGPDFGAQGAGFGSPTDAYNPSDLDGNSIIFDAPDLDNGSQG